MKKLTIFTLFNADGSIASQGSKDAFKKQLEDSAKSNKEDVFIITNLLVQAQTMDVADFKNIEVI